MKESRGRSREGMEQRDVGRNKMKKMIKLETNKREWKEKKN